MKTIISLVISVFVLLMVACQSNENSDTPPVSKRDTSPVSVNTTVAELVASGPRSIEVAVNEPIQINVDKRVWHVTLGRKYQQDATIEMTDGDFQSTIAFNSPGTFPITIESIASAGSGGAVPNIQRFELTVVVR